MLLDELYEEYMKSIELEKKRTTLDSITYRYKNRIQKKFGSMNVKEITEEMVRNYQKEMLCDELLGANYINKIVGIMRQIIDYGVRKGMLPYNDLSQLKKVKNQFRIEKKQTIWDLATFRIFESYISDDMDILLFNLLYFLGLRKGELLSLKWSSVNFEKKTITVVSTAVQIVGQGQVITTPKTNHSIREISLNETLFNLLSNYFFKVKFEYEVVSHLYIFGNKKMISFSALDRKMAKYLKLSSVEKMNLHGFRHSHATMLAHLTTDIKSISERLGHESVDVTLNEYIHSNGYAQKELARLIEDEIIQKDKKIDFDSFTDYLQKILLNEITKDSYKSAEVKEIVNIYSYIKNKEYCC